MTVTLKLPPQVEQAYLAEAYAEGLPIEDLVLQDVLLARQLSPASNQMPPDEWVRKFKAWVESHAANTVVLPDAVAVCRLIHAMRQRDNAGRKGARLVFVENTRQFR